MGYTIWPDTPTGDVLSRVNDERNRQEELKRKGRFEFSCSDPGITNAERFTVLCEEVGEVGHEINEGIGTGRAIDLVKLKKELIQVAAVAVAWAEAIETGNANATPSQTRLPKGEF